MREYFKIMNNHKIIVDIYAKSGIIEKAQSRAYLYMERGYESGRKEFFDQDDDD